jgi:hypothetical protein
LRHVLATPTTIPSRTVTIRPLSYGDELQPLLIVAPDAAIAQLLASLR